MDWRSAAFFIEQLETLERQDLLAPDSDAAVAAYEVLERLMAECEEQAEPIIITASRLYFSYVIFPNRMLIHRFEPGANWEDWDESDGEATACPDDDDVVEFDSDSD